MILIRENVEKHSDDPRRIKELMSEGYTEWVKKENKDAAKPKRKGSRKAPKADSK